MSEIASSVADIEFPDDNGRSRLGGPVSSFDPDDVATVDAKVAAFWTLYPEGAIDAADVEQVAPDSWRATAYVWKHRDAEGRPDATGSAHRTLSHDEHPSAAYPLETAQSVAIGRALRFLGIQAGKTE